MREPGRPGHHHRAAGGDRIAAVRGGGRRHDRRPAPLATSSWSRRASPTSSRRSSAASRPPAPSPAPPPTSRTAAAPRSRASSTRSPCSLIMLFVRPLGGADPAGRARGHPGGRRLPHERVACTSRRAPRARDRRRGAAHHLPADGAGGSDRGRRGRHGAGGLPVHEAHGRGDQRPGDITGDAEPGGCGRVTETIASGAAWCRAAWRSTRSTAPSSSAPRRRSASTSARCPRSPRRSSWTWRESLRWTRRGCGSDHDRGTPAARKRAGLSRGIATAAARLDPALTPGRHGRTRLAGALGRAGRDHDPRAGPHGHDCRSARKE